MTGLMLCFFCGRVVAVTVLLGSPLRIATASACDHCGSRLDGFKFRADSPSSEPRSVRNGGAHIAPDLSTAVHQSAKATEAYCTPPSLRGVA